MQIILKTDVDKLGKEGDLINVADGYARNYLIPNNFAIVATNKNRRVLEHEKRVEVDRAAKARRDAEKLASDLASVSCTISVQASESERLFGSVTSIDIANALAELGFDIDKRKIILDEPIKELGVFTVPIKIHSDVETNIKVWVVKSQD